MDHKVIMVIIAAGVAKGIFWAALATLVFGLAIAVIGRVFGIGYDDTDKPPHRSGLAIKTDHGTGLQYLTTAKGGITPRLDAQGNHMREAN